MKITIDETIELNFDTIRAEHAASIIADIKQRYEKDGIAEEILAALLTMLLFRQIEMNHPGTVDRLIGTCKKAQSEPELR